MKKLDFLIFIGLTIALIMTFSLRIETLSVDTDQILENQRLIKEALNASYANSELILSNQEIAVDVLNKTNALEELVKQHILTDTK